jgi:site-specific recombinase XerD
MNYVIRAENSKVNSDMVFGLNSELKSILEELYKYKDSIWIFSSNRDSSIHMTKLSMHYNKIRQATGLKEFTFHWMRNLLVSALAGKDGVDVTDLSALLGHNDTGTLKKYLSLQREQSSRKAADAIGKMLV